MLFVCGGLPGCILGWILSGTRSTTRRPYREIRGIDVNDSFCCGEGNSKDCQCCGDPCCGPNYVIKGLTLIPREHRGHFSNLKEMLGEIAARSNKSRVLAVTQSV